MWPLTDGERCLTGPEADLFRGAVGMMLDQLVIELNDCEPISDDDSIEEIWGAWSQSKAVTGIAVPRLFSMWEPEQRIWLLERVATSLLRNRPAPPAAAIYEATIEAVYVEVEDLIALEICEGEAIQPGSWRQILLDAFVARCPRDSLLEALHFEITANDPCLPPAIANQLRSLDQTAKAESEGTATGSSSAPDRDTRRRDWFAWWATITDRLVDATFGPRLYSQLEPLRDGNPKLVSRMLRDKGQHPHFLRRIPPLRTRGQTQAAIDRLQSIVFNE